MGTYRKRLSNFEDGVEQRTRSTSLSSTVNAHAFHQINNSEIEQSFFLNNDDTFTGQDENSLFIQI